MVSQQQAENSTPQLSPDCPPKPDSFTQLDGPAAQCPHTELQMLLNLGMWGAKRRFQVLTEVMLCNSIPEWEQKPYLFLGDGAGPRGAGPFQGNGSNCWVTRNKTHHSQQPAFSLPKPARDLSFVPIFVNLQRTKEKEKGTEKKRKKCWCASIALLTSS